MSRSLERSTNRRWWLYALVAMAMLVAVGAPIAGATHTDEHVEFGYSATPTDSTTVETGNEYTHQFAVQTNATDGPLVFVTYHNQSADIAYSDHTVGLNGTEIETQASVSNVTVGGDNLTRVRITNRSLPNNGQRTYDVDVSVSAPDSVTNEVIYTGGTHGPSAKVLPLQETTLTTESPDNDGSDGDDGGSDGGDGGSGGGGGGGGSTPDTTDEVEDDTTESETDDNTADGTETSEDETTDDSEPDTDEESTETDDTDGDSTSDSGSTDGETDGTVPLNGIQLIVLTIVSIGLSVRLRSHVE